MIGEPRVCNVALTKQWLLEVVMLEVFIKAFVVLVIGTIALIVFAIAWGADVASVSVARRRRNQTQRTWNRHPQRVVVNSVR
jgi:hypothetical protein